MSYLRYRSTYTLGYEPLESRETMAASVTASLNVSGVLNIVGTEGADTIRLQQTNGNISIVGLRQTWTAASVKSIAIDLKGGNDVVSLESLANGGNQLLQEDITVKSGLGRETVRAASGVDFSFADLGHTFVISTAGVATLDGKKVGNWFDTTVRDATLRKLGSARLADNVIDRADAMALLKDAQDGGVVDATEFSDLRTVVNTQGLFGTLEHVWKLTSYIVSGSVANATYQGQALGNLAAGSVAGRLEKLVNKWFLGLDRPTATGTYRAAVGQLFVNGATYDDIRQGYVGDCYLMASLAEAALKDPKLIYNMFIVNGDGTYTVRFYNQGKAEYVTVDSFLPTNNAGQFIYANLGASAYDRKAELWTQLVEKAFAQVNEMGWARAGIAGSGKNSYAAINGGYIHAAMGQITGKATSPFNALNFTTFAAAFCQNKLLGLASLPKPATSAIVGGHAYTVVSVNTATQSVTLMNPWGTHYGLVTMGWSDVVRHFAYFDAASV